MVPEDPRGRGAGQAGVARPDAVDGRAVDQLGSGPGPPPSQLRIVLRDWRALCLLRHWTVCLDVPSPAATSVTDAPPGTARSRVQSPFDHRQRHGRPPWRPTHASERWPTKKAEHGHC